MDNEWFFYFVVIEKMFGGPYNWRIIEERSTCVHVALKRFFGPLPDLALNGCNSFPETSNRDKSSDHNQPIDIQGIIGDGKCYCPCMQCKGIKIRRVLKETTGKHCLEYRHFKGGKQYCPLER